MAVIFIRYTDFKINWSQFTVKRTFLLSLVHMYGEGFRSAAWWWRSIIIMSAPQPSTFSYLWRIESHEFTDWSTTISGPACYAGLIPVMRASNVTLCHRLSLDMFMSVVTRCMSVVSIEVIIFFLFFFFCLIHSLLRSNARESHLFSFFIQLDHLPTYIILGPAGPNDILHPRYLLQEPLKRLYELWKTPKTP
jgi:hypothetical protein